MVKMESSTRPLSSVEQRLLSAELRNRRRLVATFSKRTAGGYLIVGGILAGIVALTRFREKGSLLIATIFWLGISAALYTWELFTTKPKLQRQVARFAEASPSAFLGLATKRTTVQPPRTGSSARRRGSWNRSQSRGRTLSSACSPKVATILVNGGLTNLAWYAAGLSARN